MRVLSYCNPSDKDELFKQKGGECFYSYSKDYTDEYGFIKHYCVTNSVSREEKDGITVYNLTKEDLINIRCRCLSDIIDPNIMSIKIGRNGNCIKSMEEYYTDEFTYEHRLYVSKLYEWLNGVELESNNFYLFEKRLELIGREKLPEYTYHDLDNPLTEVSYDMDFNIYLSHNGKGLIYFQIKDNKTQINGKFINGFNFERVDGVWYVNYYSDYPEELPMRKFD